MVKSVDVSWELDGIRMAGTVVRPDGAGPFPAVVLVAGSGPTDLVLPPATGQQRQWAIVRRGVRGGGYRFHFATTSEHPARTPWRTCRNSSGR